MASGLQTSLISSANTWTTAFTATTPIVVNISATNRAGAATSVSVALVNSGATRGDRHEIETLAGLTAAAVIERTGIVLGTGDAVAVNSLNGNVSFNIWGVEIS
jgi:threonine dehydrogenase-like Zn-dependent dehydrogenase